MALRIALISSSVFGQYIGGVTNYIRSMGRELSARGHEIVMFRPAWRDELLKADDPNIKIIDVNLGRRPYDLRGWSGGRGIGFMIGFLHRVAYNFKADIVYREVLQWNPDVVWQQDFSASWRAVQMLRRQLPVVLTNHLGEFLLLQSSRMGHLLLRRMLTGYSAIIGPCEALTPIECKRSYTIHNGVDLEEFKALSRQRRRELRLRLFASDDRIIIFCPRRWAPTKGIIFLAEAIAQLDEVKEWQSTLMFVLAGSDYGEYPGYSKKIVRILSGVKIPVRCLGNVPFNEMKEYYQASDLVVIPSLMEAVSLSAMEAFASGVCVLASRVGGMVEIIKDRETGYLVDPGDSTKLGRLIITVIKDPRREEIAVRAMEFARASYSWSSIAAMTERVLLDAVEDKKQKA